MIRIVVAGKAWKLTQLRRGEMSRWLPQVQENGLLRWRPSLLSVSQGMQLWLEHLVYCASGGAGESRLLLRKDGSGASRRWRPRRPKAYLSQLVAGYRVRGCKVSRTVACGERRRMDKSLLRCENDAILKTNSLQKARRRENFTSERHGGERRRGRRLVSRLWRTLEPAQYEAIIAQTTPVSAAVFRSNQSS
ncbi:hypothetical protein ACNKHQ_16255 [Shigella flexneri]